MQFGYTIIYVSDVEATIDFYKNAFNLKGGFLHDSKQYGELNTDDTLLLEQMRVTKVHHADNNIYTLLEDPPPELTPIYQALHIKWHKKFSHQANL